MCLACRDWDFSVAECWRPCYVPHKKAVIPTTPRGGFSDEDYDAQHKINGLMATIRAQRAEISTLKATHKPQDSRDSFEGVE
jgi:hypothetical protein